MSEPALVLTCEHGGKRVPARWSVHFQSPRARALLRSHRGWDPGALALARHVARALRTSLVACTTTRLLADANRPHGHPRLFSQFTRQLPPEARRAILDATHASHWRGVEQRLRRALARRARVIHLSFHSFTPVLGGELRNCELGLLYDPRRPRERDLCRRWQTALAARAPGLRVRRNYPYRGASAALTTSLRRRFPAARYLGIEVEINQGCWARRSPAERRALAAALVTSLSSALRAR